MNIFWGSFMTFCNCMFCLPLRLGWVVCSRLLPCCLVGLPPEKGTQTFHHHHRAQNTRYHMGLAHLLSFLAYPSWRVYSHPLSTPVVRVMLPCFCGCVYIQVFPLYNGYELSLFVACAACIVVEALQILPAFREEQPEFLWNVAVLRCFCGF